LSSSKESSKHVKVALSKDILITWEETKQNGGPSFKINHLMLSSVKHKNTGRDLIVAIVDWFEVKGIKALGKRNLDEQTRVSDKTFYSELIGRANHKFLQDKQQNSSRKFKLGR
jgi:hypothetical protein